MLEKMPISTLDEDRQTMYVVDTNVVSEARKGRNANPGVRKFWRDAENVELYFAVQTIGEIRGGVESLRRRGDERQAKRLELWLENIVDAYQDRILKFDLECAQVWGRLMSPLIQNPIDKQIAAIALIHGFKVVTRNVDHFLSTGVNIENPFT